MYINCLRKDHNDIHASAIINDSNSDYIVGSVKCMGCGMWYMEDTPENSFHTYKELLASLGKQTHIREVNNGDIIPYAKIRSPKSKNERHPKKSRLNYTGMTLKSYLKSDRHIEKDGKKIYIDKTPRVANDYVGTHESVKEFFFNEEPNERGFIDTSKGFFNRISIDSDETGDILPRLRALAEYASVGGFWFILNNGNNKFQANIGFVHTVINGHDLIKVKEIARCLNNLIGDDYMTNSFMKNHKVFVEDPLSDDLVMGAQKTRTYGFDVDLQNDFEAHLRGDSYNWENKWMRLVQRGEIALGFINSRTGKEEAPSNESICVILPPNDPEFNIRKDKSWSVSVESLWINTAVKYAKQKMEDGSIKYTGVKHGDISRFNMLVFNIVSSALKDNKKSEYNNSVIRSSLKTRVEKYLDYYKDSMRAYNPSCVERLNDRRSARYFGLVRRLVNDRDALTRFVLVVRAAIQNGLISINKKDGLARGWNRIYKNRLLKDLRPEMEVLSTKELEVVRGLIPGLTILCAYDVVTPYRGREFSRLPNELKPYFSIAVEATYFNKPGLVVGVSDKTEEALLQLAKIDYSAYRDLSVELLLATLMSNSKGFSNRMYRLNMTIKTGHEMYSTLISKSGIRNKIKSLHELQRNLKTSIREYNNSKMYLKEEYRGSKKIIIIWVNTIFNKRTSRLRSREKVP